MSRAGDIIDKVEELLSNDLEPLFIQFLIDREGVTEKDITTGTPPYIKVDKVEDGSVVYYWLERDGSGNIVVKDTYIKTTLG